METVKTCKACRVCDQPAQPRTGKRGPSPKYCSDKCRLAAKRTPERQRYEQEYYQKVRRLPDRWARILARGREYRHRLGDTYRTRMRERWRRLHGDPFPDVVLAAPYSGHRWLDKARSVVVGLNDLDGTAPWADDKYDEMGEALLALLEGRDPSEAVKEYRRKEYIPRNRMLRLSDWKDELEQRKWESVMPKEESAEDTFFRAYVDKVRYSSGTNNTALHTKGKKLNQPSKRRQKDAGWRKHLRKHA